MATPATVSIATETTAMPVVTPETKMTLEERRSFIAKLAYFKAEKRGFVPGNEEEDWLKAEQEVEALGEYLAALNRQDCVVPQKKIDGV